MHTPTFLIVDLFCGAGGTTTGFVQANIDGDHCAKVIACVNHDPKAIESHWMNHPEVKHFEEDIRTLDLTELTAVTNHWQAVYPDAYLVLWASLECTNFSKAKGGQPRDADSRTLADHLHRYIEALNPDYIQIENVVEFMSWGPLDENGKPLSRKNGSDWMRWKKSICELGYVDEWKELNSANFGAYTSRNRLFGVFAKPWLPIAWPTATHSKKPSKNGMYGDLQQWKAVKEVLDFSDQGESIFTRKKALSEKTLERIYAGLVKFIAKGNTAFISKYFSGRPAGKVTAVDQPTGTITTFGGQTLVQTEFIVQRHNGEPNSKLVDTNGPARTLTATGGNQDLVQAEFLVKYNSRSANGRYNAPSVDEPSPVISTQNRLYLAQPEFLAAYYGNGDNISSVDSPAPTIPTKDRCALVQPEFLVNYNHSSKCNEVTEPAPTLLTADKLALLKPEFFVDKHYSKSQNQSIDVPAGTIMPTDKHRLVEVSPFILPGNFTNNPQSVDGVAPTLMASRRHHYLINPGWGGNPCDINQPCCVIVARQDKAPLSFVQVEHGPVAVCIYETDSEIMVKIKQFMAVYSLVDINMRMLRVTELLKIQGFPSSYHLAGNQSDQKKFIGNSVVPHVVKAWCEAMAQNILFTNKRKTA